jgi:hypothetical protein
MSPDPRIPINHEQDDIAVVAAFPVTLRDATDLAVTGLQEDFQ